MTSTTFTNGVTLTDAGWFNDVNDTVYERLIFANLYCAGDGTTDDTAGWDSFISDLNSGKAIGIVPPNFWVKYVNTAIKTYSSLSNITIYFGENSGITFSDNTKGGFNIDACSNFALVDPTFTYVTPPTGARVGTDNHAIKFQDPTGTLKLIRPRVLASPNMGIVCIGGVDCYLDHPYVYNTLADGIHMKDTPCTLVSPETVNTGDDGIACPRTVAGGLTSMKVMITGARVTNAGARGIAINGATDVILDGYQVNNTSQHGIIVARDETYSLETPQRVLIGKGRVDNAGQYTYTATTTTKGGHGIYVIGGDNSNEITIDGPKIYNANGHGISIVTSASGYPGVVNLGNYSVDTTAVLTDGSNTPGRGVNIGKVGALNLYGKGVVKNTAGAGFFALDFNTITGDLPDVITANTGATYNDIPNFVKLNNTNLTGLATCAGGNLIDAAGTPDSTTVEIDGATTGYAVGFKVYRGDGGGLLLSNIADDPDAFYIASAVDQNRTRISQFTASNGGSTTLSVPFQINVNNNSNTIASHTLRLPTVTDEGHVVKFSSHGVITSLTVNAANGTSTVWDAPTTIAAGGSFEYIFDQSADTWIRTR